MHADLSSTRSILYQKNGGIGATDVTVIGRNAVSGLVPDQAA